MLQLDQATSKVQNELCKMELECKSTSSTQWFQIVAAEHRRLADYMTRRSKEERFLLLLGQAASYAPIILKRMEFYYICTSSS
jgi:hypothetical protein